MRKTLKLMGVSTASTLALAASMAMPLSSFALSSDTSLVNSGDDATVNSTVTQSNVINVVNTNVSTTNQVMTATSNTGNNSVGGNIGGGGSIMTGQAMAQGAFAVEGNTNVVGISMPVLAGMSGQSAEIVNTGNTALVDSDWTDTKELNVLNTNIANTTQAFIGTSNTGYNNSADNIGGTGIQTGAAGASAVMGVEVNKNVTTVNGMGGTTGVLGSAVSLTNTGDDATVNSDWTSTSTLGLMNTNMAMTNQFMTSNANSGYNGSDDNIGGGVIMTGPASAVGQFHANANTNVTGIAGWGGSVLGAMSELVNTGNNLDANSTLTNTFAANVASTNTMSQNQMFLHTMNSGYNYSADGIGGTGATMTGGAVSGGAAHAEGNNNTTVFGSVADVLLFLALGS